MASVLITRPHSEAETLAAELNRLGYSTVIEPLLTVTPLASHIPKTLTFEAVMLTSGNALLAFQHKTEDLDFLLKLPCFCVGARTADKARHVGFQHVSHSEGDGIELVRLIERRLGKAPIRLLHLTGDQTSYNARQWIEERGYYVHHVQVYTVHPATAFSPTVIDQLRRKQVTAVTVFSPRTAEVLSSLIHHHALETCCTGLAAICLSEAVAHVLKPLRWQHLVAAAKPTEELVIACLKETCPLG